MNISKCLLLALALFVPGVGWSQSQPAAPSPIEADLQRLQAQRERALAAAAVPVNRQYRAALDQLLRAAMQRGDLDGAIKVRAAMGETTGAAAAAGTPAPTNAALGNAIGAKRFAGTKWKRARLLITFGADGSFTFAYGSDSPTSATWKATSSTSAEVTFSESRKLFYRWDPDKLTDDDNKNYFPFSDGEPPMQGAKSGPSDAGTGSPDGAGLFGKP